MEVLGQVETAVKTMDSMERRASTITHQMNRLDTFRRTATLPLHDTTTTLAEARSQVNRSYYEVLKAAQVLDQASVKDVKEQEASVPVVMTQPSVNQTTVPDGPPPAGEITPPPVDAKERHAEPADEQTSMQVGGSPLDPADGANEPFAQPSNQTDEPEEGAAPPLVSHASGEAKEKEQQQWLAKITEMRDKVNETLSALQNTAGACMTRPRCFMFLRGRLYDVLRWKRQGLRPRPTDTQRGQVCCACFKRYHRGSHVLPR
jgi:hypothetical protein